MDNAVKGEIEIQKIRKGKYNMLMIEKATKEKEKLTE